MFNECLSRQSCPAVYSLSHHSRAGQLGPPSPRPWVLSTLHGRPCIDSEPSARSLPARHASLGTRVMVAGKCVQVCEQNVGYFMGDAGCQPPHRGRIVFPSPSSPSTWLRHAPPQVASGCQAGRAITQALLIRHECNCLDSRHDVVIADGVLR